MANGFGYTFSPSARGRFTERPQQNGPGMGERIGRALQVLSLRLPRVVGGRPLAPDELLSARGGPGPGAVAETLGQRPAPARDGGPVSGGGPALDGGPTWEGPAMGGGPVQASSPTPSLLSVPSVAPTNPFQQIMSDLNNRAPVASQAPPPRVTPGLDTLPGGGSAPPMPPVGWTPPMPSGGIQPPVTDMGGMVMPSDNLGPSPTDEELRRKYGNNMAGGFQDRTFDYQGE